MRRLLTLTVVFVLAWMPHLAEAQGRGRPKAPPASPSGAGSDTISSQSSTFPTSQFRQFGVWLDDATTRAQGQGSVGFGVGYWRGGGGSLTDVPMLDASYAVHDRVQFGASVPFYRSEYGGTTSRGLDDVYLSGKIVLIDPALKNARFGIAVVPVVEILSPRFTEERVHFALPVSAEFRARSVRVYGSTGYFSRGSVFGAGAVEWTVPDGTTLTLGLTHAVPKAEDVIGLTGGRTDLSIGVGHAVSNAAAVYVAFGRTLSSPDEASETTLGLSGGVSLNFASRRAIP